MPLIKIAIDGLVLRDEHFDEMNLHFATSRKIVMLPVFMLVACDKEDNIKSSLLDLSDCPFFESKVRPTFSGEPLGKSLSSQS